jgi:uncharacterized protein YggE
MTKSYLKSSVLSVCLLVLTAGFHQVSQATEQRITATGNGSVSTVPDLMRVTFWVEERGNKLSSQKTVVDNTTERLLNDLLKKDVAEKDIQSYQLQIYPQYEQDSDGKTKQSGFIVRREIKVTLRNPENYDNIIDLALSRGVTRVGQIQFEISNQQALYQQALIQAYKQAQMKSEQLAETAGLALTGTLSITERSISRPFMMQMAEASVRSDKVSLPGQQTIEASVEVVFSVKNVQNKSN